MLAKNMIACLAAFGILMPTALSGDRNQSICLCKFSVPPYSIVARSANVQGVVHLVVDVDSEGIPQEVTVVDTTHVLLGEPVSRVLKDWRFCTDPTAGSNTRKVLLTFRFRLEGETNDWSPTNVTFDATGEMDISTKAIKPMKQL